MSRPKSIYLVATYYARPRFPDQTFRAGYMKEEKNVVWDEQVIVTVGLKNRESDMAKVVLNIMEQKVVKNSFNNDKSFIELFEYYYSQYPKELSEALQKVGISFEKTEKPIDESVQENVSAKDKAGAGSEPSTATDVVGTGEGNKRRKRKSRNNTTDDTAAAGTNTTVDEKTESTAV